MNNADKLKSAKEAISTINTQYGKGTLMFLGDQPDMSVEVIPSGCISLDYILGIGGFPKGRIIEIFGPESSGKCCKEDTIIFTDEGLKEIKDCGSAQVMESTDVFCNLFSKKGERLATSFYNSGVDNTKKITTRWGYEIEGRFVHSILCNRRTINDFVQLQHLNRGDFICIQRGQNYFAKKYFDVTALTPKKLSRVPCTFPTFVNKDFARVLAYLVGEGCTSSKNCSVSNNDSLLLEDFSKSISNLFNYSVYIPLHTKTPQCNINNIDIQSFLQQCGIDRVLSEGKKIPFVILQSPKEIVAEFLRAFFEGEGHVSKIGVEITSASKKLMHQLHVLLLNFGIICRLHPVITSATNSPTPVKKEYWRIDISGNDLNIFANEIGFLSVRKNSALNDLLKSRVQIQTNVDSLPSETTFLVRELLDYVIEDQGTAIGGKHRKGKGLKNLLGKELLHRVSDVTASKCKLTYTILGKLLAKLYQYSSEPRYQKLYSLYTDNYFYDSIMKIEDGKAQVYDFVVPVDHNFTSNGVISHNTTLTLHTIAETQKRGGTCAFIDVEHALDLQYARRLGVDVKELYVSQPDYGEQALEIVNTLTDTGAIDLIVIDSVAALVPRSEIEGEMGQSSMAVQARLMSQAMRKLNGIVSKTNTTLIFINQLRSKIGVMFGSPETTSGGNALKFYASVRIDIRKIAAIKVDNVTVGSRTRLKVVKSKVSPPFREIETEVLLNEGISKYSEVLEFGVNQNIIKKGGAWYEYQESRFNGKAQFIDALKKNEILFDMLKQEILEKLKIPRSW